MASKKIYDLAVKVGEYQSNGQTKGKYENVGAILQSDDGSKMILLKRTFNPAGVPFKDGSDQIIVSMFAPKDGNGQPAASTHQQQKSNGYAPQPGEAGDQEPPF